mgnify:CR=1 FL=1
MLHLEIEKVVGREIIDSRGNPTVEAEVYLAVEQPRVVLLLESSKHWSLEMEIKTDLEAKEFLKL